jgi:RNA polymerase sigma-70 factor, ECF subfamily
MGERRGGVGNISRADAVQCLRRSTSRQYSRGAVSQPDYTPGTPQARFQALVEPHLGCLLRFAARRVQNVADAEDVVQDACIRAWVGFPDLREDGHALPWLYKILRSTLSDFHAKQGRRERLAPTLTIESAVEMVADRGAGPLEALLASVSTAQIHELLGMLPEEFALAVELHDLEGLRYVDIARTTGVPPGTVMSRIYRGRKLLAALILMNESMSDLVPPRSESGQRLHVRRA